MMRNELVNMEGNNGVTSRRGGMLPVANSMGSPGMLGLEMSLHHPHHPLPEQQQHLVPFQTQRREVAADHSHSPQPHQQLDHAAFVAFSPAGSAKRKQQPVTSLALTSQDLQEPPTFGGEYDGGGSTAAPTSATDGTRRFPQSLSPSPSSSPWQRMKWTDNMVRLLIMIVYCVGDDAVAGNVTADHGDQHSASGGNKSKKAAAASSTSAAGLLLQKKGKWKSVSRAMVEKGFYVSPQQCEDKFNDLNKRYKRVNELLGKGIACQIVENQALLDSMDNLSSKAKEETRKLLNSKHLFFREMCAYHNGGGGGGGGCASSVPASSSTCAPSQPPHSQSQSPPLVNHPRPQSQDQQCFHHPSELSIGFSKEALFLRKGGHSSGSMLGGLNMEDNEEKDQTDNNVDDETGDEDEEVEDEDDDFDDDEEEDVDHHHRRRHKNEKSKASKLSKGTSMLLPTSSISASPPLSLSPSSSSPVPMDQLRCDLMGSLASVGGEQQQRQWLKRKAAELEEQRLGYQCRALGLERQRFKWLRYSSNKEREMERMKLNYERRCLENDRMLLLLRQKEQELIDQQLHHQNQLH